MSPSLKISEAYSCPMYYCLWIGFTDSQTDLLNRHFRQPHRLLNRNMVISCIGKHRILSVQIANGTDIPHPFTDPFPTVFSQDKIDCIGYRLSRRTSDMHKHIKIAEGIFG